MSALIAGGLQSPAFATALFSLVAAVVTLGGIGRLTSWRIMLVRALPVLLLAVLASIGQAHVALVAVLVVSAAGEPLIDQEAPSLYLSGFGLFLATRVLLTALFVLAAVPALLTEEYWRLAIVVIAVLSIGFAVRRLWHFFGALRWPSVIFAVLDLAMIAAAAMVPPGWIVVAAVILAGADVGLAVNRFLTPTDAPVPINAARLVWLARYLAQALIVAVALQVI